MNASTGIADPRSRPTGSAAATRRRRGGIVLIAFAAAMAAWFVSARLIGIDLLVDQGSGPEAIRPVLVGAAPIVSGLLGWLLLAVLERASRRRGAAIWRVIAIVVLAGSLWSPITMALSTATLIALVSMHLLVGGILIIGLPPRGGADAVAAVRR